MEEGLLVGVVGAGRLEGEGGGVVVAVRGLGDVLLGEMGRHVAVVAGGDGVVRAFAPGVVLVVHDVAVDAGPGIVGEVGEALGIAEGEAADTGHEAQQDREGE